MNPEGDPKTFWDLLRMNLFLFVHRCYDCGRLMFRTPFVECEQCYKGRLVKHVCMRNWAGSANQGLTFRSENYGINRQSEKQGD
jgi:hypothetical protein